MSSFDRFQPPRDGSCLGHCTACGRKVVSSDCDAEIAALSERGLCLACFEEDEAREAAAVDAEIEREQLATAAVEPAVERLIAAHNALTAVQLALRACLCSMPGASLTTCLRTIHDLVRAQLAEGPHPHRSELLDHLESVRRASESCPECCTREADALLASDPDFAQVREERAARAREHQDAALTAHETREREAARAMRAACEARLTGALPATRRALERTIERMAVAS